MKNCYDNINDLGLLFARNKRVWENQVLNSVIAMDRSRRQIQDWREAKKVQMSVETPGESAVNKKN